MKTSYVLRKDQCTALRSYWGGRTSTGSPFNSWARAGSSDDTIQQLREIGLLDQTYQPTRNTEELLKILALPALHMVIGYVDSKTSFKVHLYMSSEERRKCVTISRADAITLFYPCITGEVIDYVNNTASLPPYSAPVPSVSFSLSRSDAAILAVLIDVQRQSFISHDQVGIKPETIRMVTFNSYEIFEILHNYKNNPLKWPILTLFFENAPFESITDEDVKKTLSRFFALGYLSRSGDGYSLDPALQNLAQNLVSIPFVLFISGIKFVTVPGIHAVNHSILGGSGSIFKITHQSRDRDLITLDIISSGSVHMLIRDLIENPESQFEDPAAGYSSKMADDFPQPANAATCPSCGTPLGGSAKFCRKCGAAAAPEERPTPVPQCPQCGSPVKTGAKFCSKCGKKLLL